MLKRMCGFILFWLWSFLRVAAEVQDICTLVRAITTRGRILNQPFIGDCSSKEFSNISRAVSPQLLEFSCARLPGTPPRMKNMSKKIYERASIRPAPTSYSSQEKLTINLPALRQTLWNNFSVIYIEKMTLSSVYNCGCMLGSVEESVIMG